ncbi:hypothetical protein [Azospirillum doebereinerae]|uniref:DUF3618 domain-containing protein n=1 Tax=Azospirillum doebereinerae TaxID=92933 RepID=A0A3S0V3N5_9PROT|nr:hypothetical protein [Azospirillum doebereinerae]MCG5241675.1 hypothetical protein [Azospirillum doebereinerae]RUQ64018.1 hypothetical protein EJ913_26580 [Azospirillum doebereinerae]
MNGTPPTGPAANPDATPDLDTLEGEIRASRARIDGTVDALRGRIARLSPRTLMERTMKHAYTPNDRDEHGYPVREPQSRQTTSRSSSVIGNVTSNPIPLALVGIGLGWLALSSTGYDRRIARSSTVRNVRHRASDAVGGAMDYARDTFSSASDSVRNAAGSVYDSASDAVSGAYDSASGAVSGAYDSASERVSGAVGGASGRVSNRLPSVQTGGSHMRERLHGVSSSIWELVEEHPVVAGAMGIALGAAIGAALPSTQYENRWVGDYADEATERAKALAMDALDRGTRAAQAAVEAAKEEVTEVASNATDAAREAAREEVKKPA